MPRVAAFNQLGSTALFTGFLMINKQTSHAHNAGDEALEPITLPGVAPSAALGLLPTLAVGVTPIEPPAAISGALRKRLLNRIAQSAAANKNFETVRLDDGDWRELAAGVRARTQHADAAGQTTLIQLAAGAVWRPGQSPGLEAKDMFDQIIGGASAVHEFLVLSGELQLEASALGSPTLGEQDYQLIGLKAPWLDQIALTAPKGASLYWHSSTAGISEFGQTQDSHRVSAGDTGWEPLRQGVSIKPLHTVGERISMLVRFEPGARVPAHGHGLTEKCLMVEGELFLGDVLLREGEFQYAPAGSEHGELFSDVGCLLFFSGAIDPAAVDPAVRISN
jgi:quercetin dioxygenase-like cupin family protein